MDAARNVELKPEDARQCTPSCMQEKIERDVSSSNAAETRPGSVDTNTSSTACHLPETCSHKQLGSTVTSNQHATPTCEQAVHVELLNRQAGPPFEQSVSDILLGLADPIVPRSDQQDMPAPNQHGSPPSEELSPETLKQILFQTFQTNTNCDQSDSPPTELVPGARPEHQADSPTEQLASEEDLYNSQSTHPLYDQLVSEQTTKPWMQQPARVQKVRDPEKPQYIEGNEDFNVWHGRYVSERYDPRDKDRGGSGYSCDPQLDSGWTQADQPASGAQGFCLFYARGFCEFGHKCNYFHHVPTLFDICSCDNSRDIFGRLRYSSHRDDMSGVGTFNSDSRSLFVGDLRFDRAQPDSVMDVRNEIMDRFEQWGEVEDVYVLPAKAIAFVRFAWRGHAEFAKEAMHGQRLGLSSAIQVKWARDDSKPSAEKRRKLERAEQVDAAVANAAAAMGPDQARLDEFRRTTGEPEKESAIGAYPDTSSQYPQGQETDPDMDNNLGKLCAALLRAESLHQSSLDGYQGDYPTLDSEELSSDWVDGPALAADLFVPEGQVPRKLQAGEAELWPPMPPSIPAPGVPSRPSVPADVQGDSVSHDALFPPLPPTGSSSVGAEGIWPPLPPGPPPSSGSPSTAAREESEDYEQTMHFRSNGPGHAQPRGEYDRGLSQVNHFCDYASWAGVQNSMPPDRRPLPGKTTGDGGRKLKRKPDGSTAPIKRKRTTTG
eukprot:TRINITY_DN57276_c0_g1_i1.p1 TRINITY_DN57276_c0_g1~~TRINITY_DN57276_c0_g1_i1.p1  ORF type:complete len:731 (-),score=108.51 TRINITY_DN57276_c0_g1_i1:219-2372(-)